MLLLRRYFSYLIVIALFFVTLGIWGAVLASTPSGVLTVAVMNVGQGDSIFIESPTGVQVVIDGGPDNSLLTELPKRMQLSDRTLDAIVATHPDADHIAGFIDLLNRYEVKNVIEPGIPKDTLTAKRFEEEVTEKKIPRHLARRGMRLDLGGGARLDILFPDFDVSNLPNNKVNEGGVVARLVYGDTSMLLTADIPTKVEGRLLALYGKALDSDILKVAHHGSRGSSELAFVNAVSPAAAIISVGGDNRYGHPTKQVLDLLAGQDIKTLRTDEEGTVVFISNGETFVLKK